MLHISDKNIRIEEYKDLISASNEFIEIQGKHSRIQIKGIDLKITSLNEEEIYLIGKIQEVIFL